MRIVITYNHRGDDQYLSMIDLAFKSARRLGYTPVLVGNTKHADIIFSEKEEDRLMNWVLAAQIAYIRHPMFDCNSVIFSPDALIVRPLQPIFDEVFDVGFTDRQNPRWPINNGVIFLKPQHKERIAAFWEDGLKICKAYPEDIQNWYGDQQCLKDLLVQERHIHHEVAVRMFPCSQYNASPDDKEIDASMLNSAYIIHLKGKRKPMMQKYWEKICSRTLS
jgi:hypothetical protein